MLRPLTDLRMDADPFGLTDFRSLLYDRSITVAPVRGTKVTPFGPDQKRRRRLLTSDKSSVSQRLPMNVATASTARSRTRPTPTKRRSAPSWIYQHPILRTGAEYDFPHQLAAVCHVRRARPGTTIPRFLWQSVIVVRGENGESGLSITSAAIGLAVARWAKGSLGRRITPYMRDLRSRRSLVGVPIRRFPWARHGKHGLVPLDTKCHGFIFVRFEAGLPSVREMAAPIPRAAATGWKSCASGR